MPPVTVQLWAGVRVRPGVVLPRPRKAPRHTSRDSCPMYPKAEGVSAAVRPFMGLTVSRYSCPVAKRRHISQSPPLFHGVPDQRREADRKFNTSCV